MLTRMAAPSPSVISVCIVEDELDTLHLLEDALRGADGVAVVHCAMSCKAAKDWLNTYSAHVLLVDLGLPDGSGLDVIRYCRMQSPATEIMVISMFGDESHMVDAFEAGARGYLLKDGSEHALADHVRNLHAGGAPMTPAIARQLLNRFKVVTPVLAPTNVQQAATQDVRCTLSARELDILSKLAKGYTYTEVAKLLGVTLSTVQHHVRNIYHKLAVNSKTEAVFEARILGFL